MKKGKFHSSRLDHAFSANTFDIFIYFSFLHKIYVVGFQAFPVKTGNMLEK